MYGDGVRPTKATGTRWVDHKIRAMERVVDMYGLYCQHLQHAITDTRKSKDRASLQEKFNKVVDVIFHRLYTSKLFDQVLIRFLRIFQTFFMAGFL